MRKGHGTRITEGAGSSTTACRCSTLQETARGGPAATPFRPKGPRKRAESTGWLHRGRAPMGPHPSPDTHAPPTPIPPHGDTHGHGSCSQARKGGPDPLHAAPRGSARATACDMTPKLIRSVFAVLGLQGLALAAAGCMARGAALRPLQLLEIAVLCVGAVLGSLLLVSAFHGDPDENDASGVPGVAPDEGDALAQGPWAGQRGCCRPGRRVAEPSRPPAGSRRANGMSSPARGESRPLRPWNAFFEQRGHARKRPGGLPPAAGRWAL